MNAHLKFSLSFAVTALSVVLATSCSLVSGPAEKPVEGHPSQESRMSDKPGPGYVATGVWRVKGHSGNVVYLAGTRHSVAVSEIPFPSTYYAAYQQSRDVFFEIDPESIANKFMLLRGLVSAVGFILEHRSELRSPKGHSLSDSLSPKTVKLLRAHYGSKYAKKEKLSALGLLMGHKLFGDEGSEETSGDDQKPHKANRARGDKGPEVDGADDHFRLLARRDGKKVVALDKQAVAQTIGPFLEFTLSQIRQDIAKKGVDAAVRESILKKKESVSEKDVPNDPWRYGISDREAEEEFTFLKQDPAMYQMLNPQRNTEWMKSITRAIEGKHTTTVFVGALHFPGKDGLLALLRKKGYRTEQMFGIDRPVIRSKNP